MPKFRELSAEEAKAYHEMGKANLTDYVAFLSNAALDRPLKAEPNEGESPNMVKRRLRKAAKALKRTLFFHTSKAPHEIVFRQFEEPTV